jgi:type I restriction-modification system DNA methylase subunit
VTLCTHGLLFRAGSDYDLRYSLIQKGWVDAVIQLPTGLLLNTNISLNVLVLDKYRNPNDPVFFYDADRDNLLEKTYSRNQPSRLTHWQKIAEAFRQRSPSEFGQLVSRETILENQCNLSVRRYISDPAAQYIQQLPNTRPLSGVATLIRSQVFKEDDATSADEFLEVGLRDIALSGDITPPNKKLCLSGKVRDKAMQLKLLRGDILLSIKGNVGQVGIVGEKCGNNWVAGQIFIVIRPNQHYLQPAYLYRYLASPVVQQYFASRSQGSAVPILQATDLNNLPVPVDSPEEQACVVQTHVDILATYERILGLEKTIQDLKRSHWC